MDPNEATAYAIECLTLWLEPGPDARERAAAHIADLRLNAVDPNHLIAGLLNLNMFTIGMLARAGGAKGADEIRVKQQEALNELALWIANGGPEVS